MQLPLLSVGQRLHIKESYKVCLSNTQIQTSLLNIADQNSYWSLVVQKSGIMWKSVQSQNVSESHAAPYTQASMKIDATTPSRLKKTVPLQTQRRVISRAPSRVTQDNPQTIAELRRYHDLVSLYVV